MHHLGGVQVLLFPVLLGIERCVHTMYVCPSVLDVPLRRPVCIIRPWLERGGEERRPRISSHNERGKDSRKSGIYHIGPLSRIVVYSILDDCFK
ncbi:hypothetical protein F5B17DRAFT_406823 [Nemania serpens]|nr:hypothetical protein F5B17DRAFT_406823 [Nemania serpens]